MTDTIKHMVLVASGKGGVGKSTVAVNLALALKQQGHAVGLLDADIYGPSLPTMFGAAPRPESDGKQLFPLERYGLKFISMGYLVADDVAMIWRGPMLASAATQLVGDVQWGDLDYLVVDLPPGTGDVQLSLAQKFQVTGAVLVTTPQEVALADVRRAKAMFDKVQVRILGLVENMSYFICPKCSERHEIFAHGGGERGAAAMGIDFLGRIPIEMLVREGGDSGVPLLVGASESTSALAFGEIARELDLRVQKVAAQTAKSEATRRALPIVPE